MTHVDKFHERRYQRLKSRGLVERNAIEEFRKRRDARLDADNEEEGGSNKPKNRVNHGNTRLPFGLCQREGISIESGWTPTDAWEALECKGYNAKEEYAGLKEGKPAGSSKKDKEEPKFTEDVYKQSKKEYEDEKQKIISLKKDLDEQIKIRNNFKFEINKTEKTIEQIKISINKAEGYIAKANGRTREQIKEEYNKAKEEYQKEEEKIDNEPDVKKQYEMYDKLYHSGNTIYDKKNELAEILNAFIYYGDDFGLSERKRVLELNEKSLEEYKHKFQTSETIVNKFQNNYDNEMPKFTESKNKYRNFVKEKFKTYDDCKTEEDVIERFRVDSYFKDDEDINISGNVNLEMLKSTAKSLSSALDKLPQIKGKVKKLSIVSFASKGAREMKETYGCSSAFSGVSLNDYFYSNPERFEKDYNFDVKMGFHPVGTTKDTVVVHEYSHQIDNVLSRELKLTEASGKMIDFSTQVMKEVKKQTGMKMDDIKKKVSMYSLNNRSGGHKEFFAEALSEYLTSESPRDIAVMVGEITKKYLNQAYGGESI